MGTNRDIRESGRDDDGGRSASGHAGATLCCRAVGMARADKCQVNRMKPEISVIVPCFNGARYLRAAIESVLRQSEPAHEVIVVDDGSTDDSFEIAARYGPPVRAIRQENR